MPERLLAGRQIDDGGHWIWAGAKDVYGYGRIWVDQPGERRRNRTVHRVAYEVFVGPIPTGMQIDHLCRVRRCFNPAHLEVVTQAENIRRGDVGSNHRNKTHCPSGHPYDLANTYIGPTGRRGCRICRSAASARSKQRRAVA